MLTRIGWLYVVEIAFSFTASVMVSLAFERGREQSTISLESAIVGLKPFSGQGTP